MGSGCFMWLVARRVSSVRARTLMEILQFYPEKTVLSLEHSADGFALLLAHALLRGARSCTLRRTRQNTPPNIFVLLSSLVPLAHHPSTNAVLE